MKFENGIAIYVNSVSIENYEFTDFSSNPGVGGTEFVALQLIIKLAEKYSSENYYIYTLQKFTIKNIPNNCIIVIIDKETIYNVDKLIIPIAFLPKENYINIKYKNVFLWSHHPHDRHHISRHFFRNSKIISIGGYQYHSNKIRFGDHNQIPNLMPNSPGVANYDKKFNGKFVYLGGLYKGKGFGDVLSIWLNVKKIIPNAELNVIGGDLYARQNDSKSKKVNEINFIKKQLGIMSADISSSIKFYGRVDSEIKNKILLDSDLAILNPKGRTEAYPASILECMSYSIPVLAGNDYGVCDVLINQDKMNLRNNNYLATIKELHDNPILFSIYRKQAHNKYMEAYNKNSLITDSWWLIINDININFNFIAHRSIMLIYIRSIFKMIKSYTKFILSLIL